jgi:hypothetical protein
MISNSIEKQINDCIKRCCHKKGWLNTRYVRSGNMASLETRHLMKVIVDRGFAFSNQVAWQDERYQICFELDKKIMMIEDLDRFDNLVLIHPLMLDIPSKSLLYDKTKLLNLKYWNALKIEWLEIYAAFCRYQNGQDIEDFQCFISSVPIANESLYLKDCKQHMLIKIRKFIKMYKAFKIGWEEIEDLYPGLTCNDLFIKIIKSYYDDRFRNRIEPMESINHPEKQIIHSRKNVALLNFSKNIRRELERLSECEKSNSLDRNIYKLALEKYNHEPHGQGREEAFAVLKKVAQKDTQVMQVLMDFHQALSFLGKFSEESKHRNFDDFLECDGIGDFVSYDDPKSYYLFRIDRELDLIKDVMRTSSDPKVRAVVSEWVEAISKIHDFDVKISRRNEQNPEKRY